MRVTRLFVVALIGSSLMLAGVGCESKSKKDSSAGSAQGQKGSAAAAKPDDPEAVASLEKAGVKLQKDSSGNVTQVDMREAGGGNAELFALAAKLQSVKTIICTGADVNNAAVQALQGHPALERFDAVSRSGVGDAAAEALGSISTLVDLNLEKSEISDAAYPHFAKLKKLKRLRAPFTKTTDVGVKALADSTQIELLDFRDCTGVSDEGILALEKLTKLRSFKVWGSQITDKSLPALGKFTALSSLGLQDTHVGGGEELAGLTKLVDLDVFRSHFNDSGLKAVTAAPGIKILKLRDCRITPEGMKLLSNFKNLERLDLSETKADDSTLEAVSGLTKLVELELWTTRITDAGLAKITALPLENLVLEDIYDISDAGMEHVGKIKTLKTLTLSKTSLSDDGLKQLEGLTSLEKLVMENTVVSKKGVNALREKLPKLQTVQY